MLPTPTRPTLTSQEWHRAALAYQAVYPEVSYRTALCTVQYDSFRRGGISEVMERERAQVSHPAALNSHTPQTGITAQELARQAQELMAQCAASGPGRAISATEAVARVRRQMATA